jgi:type I restriction enzyme R subunit
VIADGIQILVKEVPLLSKEFEEKVGALRSDDAKASEMEHAIRHEIHVRLEENPAFYQSLRERLEAIIQARREARIQSAQELLAQLHELRTRIGAEQQTAREMGLTPTGFAIYGLLGEHRPPQVAEASAAYNEANRDLATLVDETLAPLTQLVDWWQKEDLQREMRQKIKRQLRASGLKKDAVDRLASEIVDLAKVRADR